MVNITGERKKKITTRIAREFVDYNYDCASAVPNLSLAIEEAMRNERQDIPWAIQKAGYARLMPVGPIEVKVSEYDFGDDTYTARFNCYSTPCSDAKTAWDTMTGGKEFDGDADAFYKALNDYGELYAAALMNVLRQHDVPKTQWNETVTNVLKLAGGDSELRPVLHYYVPPEFRDMFMPMFRDWDDFEKCCRRNGGLDSMLEAYEAGVPAADIIG